MPVNAIGTLPSNPYLTADAARAVLAGTGAPRPAATDMGDALRFGNLLTTAVANQNSPATIATQGIGGAITSALDNVQATDKRAADLSVAAVTGSLQDVHSYTIAASEAKLTVELTAAVRNKAVESFNEIMRMQA